MVVLLLVSLKAYSISYPAKIWFLDGTIKSNVERIIIDSAHQMIVYLDKNKFNQAYFDEIFAITSDYDTVILTPVRAIGNEQISTEQMFELLQGIYDGLHSKHYQIFIESMALSYLSNLAFCEQNIIVRNAANLINFYYHCIKPIAKDKVKTFYDMGYQIGLQKRRVVETAAGIVVGNYLEMLTEAALMGSN